MRQVQDWSSPSLHLYSYAGPTVSPPDSYGDRQSRFFFWYVLVIFRSISVTSLIFACLELPWAIAQAHTAIANYTTASSLVLDARRQLMSSVEHVGAILHSTSGNGARTFPTNFDVETIVAATALIDTVQSPNFLVESEELASLMKFSYSTDAGQALADESSQMVISTPPAPIDDEALLSPKVTPPAKLTQPSTAATLVASSSRLAAPLFIPIPELMTTRTISQGESSTSSIPPAGQSTCSGSGKLKRKK